MPFWRRNRAPVESGQSQTVYLAELARTSNSFDIALEMALMGVEPDKRAELLISIVRAMPAAAQLAILNSSDTMRDALEATIKSMQTTARQKEISRLAVREAQRTLALDVSHIAPEMPVKVGLMKRPSELRSPHLVGGPGSYNMSVKLDLHSLGDGRFVTRNELKLSEVGGPAIRTLYPERAVRLGAYHPDEGFSTTVRYGSALLAQLDGTSYNFLPQPQESLVLGAMAVDGVGVFNSST